MSLDLKPALRDAMMDIGAVTAALGQWKGEPAVFTRRPVPDDATYPCAVIDNPASVTDQDGLASDRPVLRHNIAFYGNKGTPGAAGDQTRDVETMAFAAREHFHRERFSIQPAGYSVVDIVASGPVVAPVSDESKFGMLVSLTVRLKGA